MDYDFYSYNISNFREAQINENFNKVPNVSFNDNIALKTIEKIGKSLPIKRNG